MGIGSEGAIRYVQRIVQLVGLFWPVTGKRLDVEQSDHVHRLDVGRVLGPFSGCERAVVRFILLFLLDGRAVTSDA